MAVELSEYEPGDDDDEVLALRARVWGAEHPYNHEGYFRWLFRDNPAGRGSGVVLRSERKIVGFAGLAARRMCLAGAITPVAQALDYMVDAGARGGLSGLYGYRLMERWHQIAIARGYRFGMGFPNANSSRLVTSPKLGWRPVFSPVLLLRPYGGLKLPTTSVRGVPPVAATAGLNMLAGWSRLSQALRVRPVPGRAMQIATFDGSFDGLHAGPDTSSMVGTSRESAYLNWRFVNHPLNQYDCVGWENSGKICGYIVTIRRDVFGFVATLVVDLAAASDTPDVEFALLSEVQRRSRKAGASLLATLAVAGSSRFHRLRRFGFLPVPRRLDPKPFLLTVHGLGGSADHLTEPTAWRFNWSDMDVV